MTRRPASRALSVLDQSELRNDVSPEHAPQHGRVEDLVGEDPGGGSGEGAILKAVHDGDVGAGRADLELEGQLEDVLLVGQRNAEDVFLLRLHRRSALVLDDIRDQEY